MTGLTITKKVRLDKQTAATLKRLSKMLNMTESGVLREALTKLDAAQDREQAIQALRELFPGPEPPKERYRFQ